MSAIGEIEIFAEVIAQGSFTKAAKRLSVSQSLVSRSVAALEERLGVRLLHRNTRQLNLTAEGRAFYDRCSRILADLREAELAVTSAAEQPRGRIRVDAPVAVCMFIIIPALPGFFARYPEVTVDLSLRDHFVDIVGEGIDVAIRLAELSDSSLIARRLGSAQIAICGAPAYFARRGKPTSPDDLAEHDCLVGLVDGAAIAWRFRDGAGERTVDVNGALRVTTGTALLESARAGLGLARLFDFLIAADVAKGSLETVLDDYAAAERPIYALYPASRHLTPRVRVFVDYIDETWQALPRLPSARKTSGRRRRPRPSP